MPRRDPVHDKDQEYDPQGAEDGDTGKTAPRGTGQHAEKGDQRRQNPVHHGPT